MPVSVRSVHILEGARETDNRASPPIVISGPAARVRLDVEGKEVVVDVPPLELLEFRARLRDPALWRFSADRTAAVLAVRFVRESPSSDSYRVLMPQAAEVRAEDLDAIRQLFSSVEEVLSQTNEESAGGDLDQVS